MRFRVPGSTSNLGHGFDCLGMAVNVANELTLTPVESDAAARSEHTGLDRLCGAVREQCQIVFGQELPPLKVAIEGSVPIARGLGSSATIIIAVAAAYARLAGLPEQRQELVNIGYGIEGHPDNVAAAALGGITIAAPVAGELRCLRLPVPDQLRAVLIIPPYEVATARARQALPDILPREQAVRGWQRTALITAALASGNLAALADCFTDAWHESHRAGLNPGLVGVRQAAREAGALGTFLSGSGSTIFCLCDHGSAPSVHAAMQDYAAAQLAGSQVILAQGDNQGVTLLSD